MLHPARELDGNHAIDNCQNEADSEQQAKSAESAIQAAIGGVGHVLQCLAPPFGARELVGA